jgi:hypothetical protein
MKKLSLFLLAFLFFFGAKSLSASAACTPISSTYPGSLDTFVANDCIPSSWANQLEQKLGITSSSVTSSLDYQINNLFTSYGSEIVKATSTTGLLQTLNNLSDLTNLVSARANLGLGSAATHPFSDFLPSSTPYSTVSTSSANSWTQLQTLNNGLTVNGTTTLASTTSALVEATSTGQVIPYPGSTCSAGTAYTGLSATGTPVCTAFGSSNVSTSSANTWSQVQSTNGVSNTGNATSTSIEVTGTSTASFVANANMRFQVPPQATLTAFGFTDVTQYMANIYAAYNGVVSSTEFDFGAGNWPDVTTTTFNFLGDRVYITGVPGGGSRITYTPTSTGAIWTINNGSGSTGGQHTSAQGVNAMYFQCSDGSSTALLVGGTLGAEGTSITNNTFNHCPVPIESAGNTWELTIDHNFFSSYATGTVFDSSNNSGEMPRVTNNDYHDNTNSTTTNGFVMQTASTIGATVCWNSFDDTGVNYGAGNVGIKSCNYFENPGWATYGSYPFLKIGANSTVVSQDTFGNDASTTGNFPPEDISNAGTLIDAGITTVANGTATTTPALIVDTGAGTTAGIGVINVPNSSGGNAVSSTIGSSVFNALTFWIEPAYGTSTPDLALGTQGTVNSSTFMTFDGNRVQIGYDPSTIDGTTGQLALFGGGSKGIEICVNGTANLVCGQNAIYISGTANTGVGVAAVGINTQNPSSTLDVNGSFGEKVTTSAVSSTMTALASTWIYTGTTAGTFTLTNCTSTPNRQYLTFDDSSSTLTIAATSTNFIWPNVGGATSTSVSVTTSTPSFFVCDGTNWHQK